MRGPRSWTTDEIGDEGEAVVSKWGRDADISMAKHDPDRRGIDRWFELRADRRVAVGAGLDSAPAHVQGFLQVKASICGRPDSRVALSLWKRFVDCDFPCFFVGIELDGSTRSLQFIRAHVLHVDETVGAIALRRMRMLDADDPTALAEKLAIPWQHASVIESGEGTADAFEIALRSAVGESAQYSERKRLWRETVGFDEFSQSITASMDFDAADVNAVSLGDVAAPSVIESATTVRWGIERPGGPPLGAAEIRFSPRPVGDAVLRVGAGDDWTSIDGELICGVPLGGLPPVRFQARALHVDITNREPNELKSATFHHRSLADPGVPYPLDDCLRAARIIERVYDESCNLELIQGSARGQYGFTHMSERPQELLRALKIFDGAALAASSIGLPRKYLVRADLLYRQRWHLGVWEIFASKGRESVMTLTDVTHDGPLAVVIPTFVALGTLGLVVRVFAFGDDTPKRHADGRITIVPTPLAASPPELVSPSIARDNFDLVTRIESLADRVDAPLRGVIREPTDKVLSAWTRALRYLNTGGDDE